MEWLPIIVVGLLIVVYTAIKMRLEDQRRARRRGGYIGGSPDWQKRSRAYGIRNDSAGADDFDGPA